MKMSNLPNVIVVILNWNGCDDTLECLDSVVRVDYANFKIVVIDNGSTDGSMHAIPQRYPEVTFLQAGANFGYAGGNNRGISWALEHGADYILILNNDTIVHPDLINVFVQAANYLPIGSILGAKIYFFHRPDTLWFAGGRWNHRLHAFEHIGQNQLDGADYAHRLEVDYITGCALFSSASTFNEVGLLDENFFLTYEETDWCYRARKMQHRCFVIPEAKLWHKVAASFGGRESPLYSYFLTRNKLLWARKHLPLATRINIHKKSMQTLRHILLPRFYLSSSKLPLPKNLLWSFSSWLKTIKRNMAVPTNCAILLGLRDYYMGRFGNCPDQVRSLGKQSEKLTLSG
jgi:GT2 family glycosyltransferase